MASSPPLSPISPSHLTPPTNLPTQTYHTSILPHSIPTAALLDSAVGGAHYSGVESVNERRRSIRSHTLSLNANENGGGLGRRRSSVVAQPNTFHLTVVDDLKDVCDSHRRNWSVFILKFSWWWLDVRGFRDKGNAAEAMEQRCGIRGTWLTPDLSPTLTSSGCSLDGYMQDPYTRCKGLNEIAPQVNHRASLFPAVDSPC